MNSNLDGLNFYVNLLGPLENVLIEMERRGLLIDKEYFKLQAISADSRAEEITLELNEWTLQEGAGIINWRSPDQKLGFIHEKLYLPTSPVCGKGKTKKNKDPADSKALEWFRDYSRQKGRKTHARMFERALELQKCYSSSKYLTKFPLHADENNYVHCNMAPDTKTFRLAARCPELQQVPVRKEKDPYHIRKGFIAPPGMDYIVADQSQLEMRILGHLLAKMFGDHSLIKDILDSDCHSKNVIKVYGRIYDDRYIENTETGQKCLLRDLPPGQVKSHPDVWVSGKRDTIKNIAYGLIYGLTIYRLAFDLKDDEGEPIGKEKAEVIYNMYLDLYPGLRELMRWAKEFVIRNGGMYDLLGGFVPIPDAHSEDSWKVEAAARLAMNIPMQRGAACLMALIMLLIERDPVLKRLGYIQCLQIHDEINGYSPECNTDECMIRKEQIMETALELLCPLEVKAGKGKSWYDAK